MKQYIFFITLIITTSLFAQNTTFDKYNWNTIPEEVKSDTVQSVNGVKVTFERRIKEVYLNTESYFEEINVFHRKIKLETHNAIDINNKIYIPVNDVIEILNIKARFISSTGKITELPQESIKELDNLDNKGDFKIFAIEGIEIGGEIEYFYTLRSKFNTSQAVWMQGEEPRANVEVFFVFPSNIEYITKSYNGLPDFATIKNDSTGITTMQLNVDYIPALASEEYTKYRAHLMRFEYTLAYNRYNSSLRVYSWAKVSANLYNNLYVISKAEKSAVSKLAKKLEISNGSIEQKVRAVESYIKSEISVSEALMQTPDIKDIIEYKQTTKYGATRLFVNVLLQLNIPFELVLTCDRNNREFDPEFNGWNFLDNYLIYFPDLDQYIVPDNPDIRLGVNATEYQGQYGLFLHPINYNEKLGSLGYKVKKLPVSPVYSSHDSLLIKIDCNLNKLQSNVIIHRELSGVLGYSFQSFWEGINDEKRKEIVGNVFDMGDKKTNIQSFSVKNGSRIDIGRNPFVMDVYLIANSIIESAGNDYIFNVGQTIGTQSEMYQKTERKLPVDIDFAHGFYRSIEIKIPNGYKISNLEDIKMKVEMKEDGMVSAYFTSWYELRGSTVFIYSREMYPKVSYPIESFNEFREVINAAADFNKKSLIFTPVN